MQSSPTSSSQGQFGRVGVVLGVALAYFVAAKFGMSLAFATEQVTAIWPPTGVAFASIVLFGRRAWFGVYLGAFLANATAHEPMLTAAGIAFGNTLAGISGVFFATRVGRFSRQLDRVSDVMALGLLGAVGACSISATIGVCNLVLGGLVPLSAFWSVWHTWWIGDALGVLLVAPCLLAWLPQSSAPRWTRSFELGLVTLALLSICDLALAEGVVAAGQLRFEYAVFPFVIWLAVRFGLRAAASASLAVCSFAVWGAIHERGPFAIGTPDQRLILLDTFVATVALTALTLSALVAERRKVQLALESSRNELERRVIERTEALAIANTELMQRNEEVQGFVYIVSHDLRAPLVNLQGFSLELSRSCAELEQRLVQSELSPDRLAPMQRILSDEIASALRFISASTKKFERLIEALLALSRYGRQSLAIECVDVRTLINSTLDSLRSSIVDTRTEFMLKELPPVRGDVTALGQVFANLIVNALKYHHPGRSPRIEIGGQLEGDRVRYWVADNGAGIPGAVQHRVFQVFQRFHPERVGGEGMGLAIAKRVVERHGGTITFESEEGTGTKFILMLPAAVAREEAA